MIVRIVRSTTALTLLLMALLLAALPSTAYQRPGRTELVSRGLPGSVYVGWYATIDDAGRRVAYYGYDEDQLRWDVYLYDRAGGATINITEGANDHSYLATISGDGSTVAFWSNATNLAPADPSGPTADIHLYDTDSGETTRVPRSADPVAAWGSIHKPSLSTDARYVAYQTWASYDPRDTNTFGDAYVYDRETGTTELVSVTDDGEVGDGATTVPQISGDGRFVVFETAAENFDDRDVQTPNGLIPYDVYLHDRATRTTTLVSANADGVKGNGPSISPQINADGRYIVYSTHATNLFPADANGAIDVVLWDRQTGLTERISAASSGEEANGSSAWAFLSPDGRYVAFQSEATNLVEDNTNECTGAGCSDIFVHDRTTGTLDRVSTPLGGGDTIQHSAFPRFAKGAREVLFASPDPNLTGDQERWLEVFVRDRGPETGVGDLEVEASGGSALVRGWATFAPREISAGTDPLGDGAPTADLRGARVIHAPEDDSLLLELRLEELWTENAPPVIGGNFIVSRAGAPGLVYAFAFEVDGVAYEVRATRIDPDAPGLWNPLLTLHRCDPACERGDAIRWEVPLEALGAGAATAISGLRARVAVEATGDTLDALSLIAAAIAVPEVHLGTAPEGANPEDVVFDRPTDLAAGEFLDGVVLPEGHTVWAQACLGQTCGIARAP